MFFSVTARATIFRYLDRETYEAEEKSFYYLTLAIHELYLSGKEEDRILAENMTVIEKALARTYIDDPWLRFQWLIYGYREGDEKRAHNGLVLLRTEILPEFISLISPDLTGPVLLSIINRELRLEKHFLALLARYVTNLSLEEREYFNRILDRYDEENIMSEYALAD